MLGTWDIKKNKPDLSRKITHRRESGRRGEKKKFKKSQISSFSEIWQQPAFLIGSEADPQTGKRVREKTKEVVGLCVTAFEALKVSYSNSSIKLIESNQK